VTVLLVLLGGAIGAPARYLTDRWVQARNPQRFPLGTLLINLGGCLLLGLVTGGLVHRHWPANVQALLGTGFCGGLTTFSTFSVEAVELWQGRFTARSLAYVAISCALGLALAAVGYALV
jgi:CrcB protein